MKRKDRTEDHAEVPPNEKEPEKKRPKIISLGSFVRMQMETYPDWRNQKLYSDFFVACLCDMANGTFALDNIHESDARETSALGDIVIDDFSSEILGSDAQLYARYLYVGLSGYLGNRNLEKYLNDDTFSTLAEKHRGNFNPRSILWASVERYLGTQNSIGDIINFAEEFADSTQWIGGDDDRLDAVVSLLKMMGLRIERNLRDTLVRFIESLEAAQEHRYDNDYGVTDVYDVAEIISSPDMEKFLKIYLEDAYGVHNREQIRWVYDKYVAPIQQTIPFDARIPELFEQKTFPLPGFYARELKKLVQFVDCACTILQ